MLVLSVFVPWSLNGPRKLSECLFERFRGLVAKWPQEALRMFVLSVFVAWWPNDPRRFSECSF